MTSRSSVADPPGQDADTFMFTAPQIGLPKGGGAIRGIGEKFSANPVTGSGSMTIPIACSPGRSGFGPQLNLSYDSASGNGPFGLGWSLPIPAVVRKTERGIPRYRDDQNSDDFILGGSEDLVPFLNEGPGGRWTPERRPRAANGISYRIDRYRPRIESGFGLIERWTSDLGDTQWRVVSRDNVTTIFGADPETRIADPDDPQRVFSWLVSRQYDDKGNVVVYTYKPEDDAGVDGTAAHERNRAVGITGPQRYLKHIYYGNRTPYLPDLARSSPADLPAKSDWMFEIVFDYGEHDRDIPTPNELPAMPWTHRADAFSTHRPGFELRTRRLCERVLMFHHFSGETGVGRDCLVRSTEFEYDRATDRHDPLASPFASLRRVWQTGCKRRAAPAVGYRKRVTPPVELTYSRAVIADTTREIDAAELANLPVGTSGPGYIWVDLDGEGLSGVLTEQGGAWFYAANLGATRSGPTFDVTRVVAERPSFASMSSGRQQLLDLAGDGEIDLVEFGGANPGFQERTMLESWHRFTPFKQLPNVNWNDPKLRFVDLTGDGRADVLITEDDVFTWHPSLGEDGFGAAEVVRQPDDEERGPRLLVIGGGQSIFTADMTGDGLHDIVRIRNEEISYWPARGYARFGAKVTMDNSPCFDHPDLFDPRRIRLADVDGSGPTDVIYLGHDSTQLFINRSGGSLSDARTLPFPVATDNLAAVQVADLFGNGTACLVWSSALPADAGSPARYLDLMGGQKPHLLTGVRNNLGGETLIEYAPSTKFYVADKLDGRPWMTRLPFPVHCVERVTTKDRWRGTSFTTQYSYHHGYFDGHEREFRGFARIEQVDVEAYGTFAAANVDSPYVTRDTLLYQPPIKTITWFHTGAVLAERSMHSRLRDEYFPTSLAASPHAVPTDGGFAERPMLGVDLDAADLAADEWREATRACKGMTLRQETYELDVDALNPADGSAPRELPVRLFSAVAHEHRVRRLQPAASNRWAVFQGVEREVLTYHYEQDLRAVVLPTDPVHIDPLQLDPRVGHDLNLSFDEYGNVQQSVSIGYRRSRSFDDPDLARHHAVIRAVQYEQHVGYTEFHYTDRASAIDPAAGSEPIQYYRLRVPCGTQTYELTGLTPPPNQTYFSAADFLVYDLSVRYRIAGSLKPIARTPYHDLPLDLQPTMRLVEDVRTLFFADDPADSTTMLKSPLAFGSLGRLGLVFQTYKLALTVALIDRVLGDKLTNSVRQVLDTPHISGYERSVRPAGAAGSADWWIASGTAGFAADAADHFYLAEKYIDPFGNETNVSYDGRDLFVESSRDALGNTTTVTRFDYRVLCPSEIEDANANRTEVRFDVLGRVVALAIKGKGGEADNLTGFDDDLANPSAADLAKVFRSQPVDSTLRRLLGNATTRFLYHFGDVPVGAETAWAMRPAGACAIVRERHVATLAVGEVSPFQVAFECSDGNGSVLMTRTRAERVQSNGSPRWVVSGKTVLNNKGKPVKQYEPYFSVDAACSAEGDIHEEVGVTPLMFYDAPGRLVRTDLPDGTFSRVEFSPWHVANFDANDSVMTSEWYRDRGAPDPRLMLPAGSSPDTRAAWLAAQHADTPSLTILDSLGRDVITIEHNRVDSPAGPLTLGGRPHRDEFYLTFSKLDAEGKPLWIRDARGNLVVQYVLPNRPPPAALPISNTAEPTNFTPAYDLAGNLIFQHSMDAGDRWMLNDAAGKPMLAWDFNQHHDVTNNAIVDEGRVYSTDYDALHRPVAAWLAVDARPRHMIERFEYVDATQNGPFPSANAARNRNLCGQLYRHYDASGLVQVERIDFNGNVVETRRQLTKDHTSSRPDWQANPSSQLEPESFTKLAEHDAVGRLARLYNWHRPTSTDKRVAVYEPEYNERGLLVRERLIVGAARNSVTSGQRYVAIASTQGNDAIADITYNAKGQKVAVTLGSGTITRYEYDLQTFRLRQLRTTRLVGGQTDPPFPTFSSNLADARVLQQLTYTYDAAGNVTEIDDQAYKPVFWAGGITAPRSMYAYDALYRLTSATGRETAEGGSSALDGAAPGAATGFPITDQTLRRYSETYAYDEVGNFVTTKHVVAGDSAAGWTRNYETHADSNQLRYTWIGGSRIDQIEYRYDTHGNTLNLARVSPHRYLRWDHRDMISAIDLGGGGVVSYQYDSSKQRTRKRIDSRNGGGYWERIDLGGYELYRRYVATSTAPVEEIETLHLMDGEQRLLVVDGIITTNRAGVTPTNLYRYVLSNHLGSSTGEVDESGRVISHEEYHPYGTSAYRSARNAAEVNAKRFTYAGKERDEETGLSYHGARHYAPGLGRWMSCDPAGLADGVCVYRAVRNNPIAFTDTTGTQAGTPPARGALNYDQPDDPQLPAPAAEPDSEVHIKSSDLKPGAVLRATWDPETKQYTVKQLYDYLPPPTDYSGGYGGTVPPPRPTVDELLQYNREHPPNAQQPLLILTGGASGVGGGLLMGLLLGIAAGGTVLLSGGINLFNQLNDYWKDPDNFQFNALGFMWDTGAAPIGQKGASMIFGRWSIWNYKGLKGVMDPDTLEVVFKPGILGNNPLTWFNYGNLLKAEAAFAVMGSTMALLRSLITGTDATQNLQALQKGFGWGAAQGIAMEALLDSAWGERFFVGGREGFRYQMISRLMSIVRAYFFPSPNKPAPAKRP